MKTTTSDTIKSVGDMPDTFTRTAVIGARIFARLSPAWVLYAASKDRGDYRGFAALHDLCDANMLVVHEFPMPEHGTEAQMANYFAACSPIMQEVTRLIVDSPLASLPTT